MSHILRLARPDFHLVIAAVAHLHAEGLDRGLREEPDARALLVGERPWQVGTEYPSWGEVLITLHGLIRACNDLAGETVVLALPTQRFNIVLAALSRFTRLARGGALDRDADVAAVLAGQAFGLTPCRAVRPTEAGTIAGAIRRGLIGQAIAA